MKTIGGLGMKAWHRTGIRGAGAATRGDWRPAACPSYPHPIPPSLKGHVRTLPHASSVWTGKNLTYVSLRSTGLIGNPCCLNEASACASPKSMAHSGVIRGRDYAPWPQAADLNPAARVS
ncbi:hypothetical protein MHYP_G00120180 [Metynnis hypsauchen]